MSKILALSGLQYIITPNVVQKQAKHFKRTVVRNFLPWVVFSGIHYAYICGEI